MISSMIYRRHLIDSLHRADADSATPQPSAERVHCGKCGKTFSGGQVVTSERFEYSDRFRGFITGRMCYCDHCDHVFSWLSGCNDQGVPYGGPLSSMGYIRSRRSVDAWKKKHARTLDPEAA